MPAPAVGFVAGTDGRARGGAQCLVADERVDEGGIDRTLLAQGLDQRWLQNALQAVLGVGDRFKRSTCSRATCGRL